MIGDGDIVSIEGLFLENDYVGMRAAERNLSQQLMGHADYTITNTLNHNYVRWVARIFGLIFDLKLSKSFGIP